MKQVLVLIPTYNRPGMCRRAVDSVLQQNSAAWTVGIVKNHGSALLKEYERELEDVLGDRVRLLVTEQQGLGNALNVGVSHFGGAGSYRYFANLEDDDEWDPDFLRVMLREARKSGADATHCQQVQVPEQRQSNGGPMSTDAIRRRNWINFPMCLFRMELFDRVGGFCNEAGPATDWDWHLRCLKAGAKYRFVPQVLVTHHWHRDNYCLRVRNTSFVTRRIEEGFYG